MRLKINEYGSKFEVLEFTNLEKYKLNEQLNLKEKGYVFKKTFKLGLWDGIIEQFKQCLIPSGLWNKTVEIFSKHKIEIKENDKLEITKKYITLTRLGRSKTVDSINIILPICKDITELIRTFEIEIGEEDKISLNHNQIKIFDRNGIVGEYKKYQIPIGLWSDIRKICKDNEFKLIIENEEKLNIEKDKVADIIENVRSFCNEYYEGYIDKRTDTPFFPYNHQIEAVARILKYKGCLIEVATSGGKTLILSTLIFHILKNIKPDAKILIIVPSKTLVNQFYNDIKGFCYGYNNENENPVKIGVQEIMGADEKPRCDDGEINIYIGTYQSLVKKTEKDTKDLNFFKQFHTVCVDEGHSAKCISILKILIELVSTATFRIGMSGTFPRHGTAEILQVKSLLGALVYKVPAKELMELGLIANVKIKVLRLNHHDLEFAQNIEAIKKRGGGKKAWELEKEYAQNSQARLMFVFKMTENLKQNSLLIFHNIEYGSRVYEFLRDNLVEADVYYIDGSVKGKKRNHIKALMENTDGKKKILVATYGTLSTGVSINAIFNIIMLDSFKSDRIITQTIGRALRLHGEKANATIYDLVDIFYPGYKTVLLGQYEQRKKDIYDYREYKYIEKEYPL